MRITGVGLGMDKSQSTQKEVAAATAHTAATMQVQVVPVNVYEIHGIVDRHLPTASGRSLTT
jgi:hypothetical protein